LLLLLLLHVLLFHALALLWRHCVYVWVREREREREIDREGVKARRSGGER